MCQRRSFLYLLLKFHKLLLFIVKVDFEKQNNYSVHTQVLNLKRYYYSIGFVVRSPKCRRIIIYKCTSYLVYNQICLNVPRDGWINHHQVFYIFLLLSDPTFDLSQKAFIIIRDIRKVRKTQN